MKEPTHFSALVPFAGFYETSHDRNIDYVEEFMFSGDCGEITSQAAYEAFYSNLNYGPVFEAYAKAYVAALAHVIGIPLEYEEMVSPREYNFSTDRLFAKISRSDLAKMLRAVRGKRLDEKAADWFTSRSGFCSSYPSSVSHWPRIADWDHNHVGAVLSCYVDKLFDAGEILDETGIATDLIEHEQIEEWLAEAAESSPLAWAGLRLSDLIRWRAEPGYQSLVPA
jgi:hypothetical protein